MKFDRSEKERFDLAESWKVGILQRSWRIDMYGASVKHKQIYTGHSSLPDGPKPSKEFKSK